MLFSDQFRVREVELARALAGCAQIFALDRSDALPRQPQGLWGKLLMRIRLMSARFCVLEKGEITRFQMPLYAATGPVFNRVAAALNHRRLEAQVRHLRCSHVFLSSPFFFLPPLRKRRDYCVHFDLIDNFYDEWPDTLTGRSRRRFLRDAMRNADTLSACSHSLCEQAERLSGRRAAYAPNGVPVERFRRFTSADGEALRDRLGLNGRFVIGFIGNHNMEFDGMARLLDGFSRARDSRPELALLIVGPGGDKLASRRGLGREQGVWVIGPVPPDEAPAYFLACDGGVHPYDPRPLTHDATPLNVVEFSFCGKPLLSNPLRELQRLALPNMRFARDESVQAWAEALADPATFAACDEGALRQAVAPFDWAASAAIIRREMKL